MLAPVTRLHVERSAWTTRVLAWSRLMPATPARRRYFRTTTRCPCRRRRLATATTTRRRPGARQTSSHFSTHSPPTQRPTVNVRHSRTPQVMNASFSIHSFMQPASSTRRIAWSVCLSGCVLDTTVSRAKTAEPIEMLFGEQTCVGSENHVLDGSAH